MSTDGSGELTKRRPLPEWMYATPDGRNQRIAELEAEVVRKSTPLGRIAAKRPLAEPSAPGTAFVFWTDEGYGYAFKSVAAYKKAIARATVEAYPDIPITKAADAVAASALDLGRYVRVGKGGK